MKILAVRAELLHAERQTDVKKSTVAFRNFAKAPKYCCCIKENRFPNTKVIYFCKAKYSPLIVKIIWNR